MMTILDIEIMKYEVNASREVNLFKVFKPFLDDIIVIVFHCQLDCHSIFHVNKYVINNAVHLLRCIYIIV